MIDKLCNNYIIKDHIQEKRFSTNCSHVIIMHVHNLGEEQMKAIVMMFFSVANRPFHVASND